MASSDEGESFEVDEILGQRKKGRTVEYLVRWKGQDDDEYEDSWEPARNLKHARNLIEAFSKKEKNPKSGKTVSKTESSSSRSSRSGTTRSTTTTKTTTVVTSSGRSTGTSKVPAVESEASSPESSPVLSRKTVTQRREIITRDSSSSRQRAGSSESGLYKYFGRITWNDLPIIILLVCLLTIAVTFVIEGVPSS